MFLGYVGLYAPTPGMTAGERTRMTTGGTTPYLVLPKPDQLETCPVDITSNRVVPLVVLEHWQ